MKIKKLFALILALSTLLACVALAGCTQQEAQMQYEVPNYQGLLKDGQEKSDFNKELFYRNDKFGDNPDPFILDTLR